MLGLSGMLLVLLPLIQTDLSSAQSLSTQKQDNYCRLIGNPVVVESVKFHIIKDGRSLTTGSSYDLLSANLPCIVGKKSVIESTFRTKSAIFRYFQELDSNFHHVIVLPDDATRQYLFDYYVTANLGNHVSAHVSFWTILSNGDKYEAEYNKKEIENIGIEHTVNCSTSVFYYCVQYLLVNALPAAYATAFKSFNVSSILPFKSKTKLDFDEPSSDIVLAGVLFISLACVFFSFCICIVPVLLGALLNEDFENRDAPDDGDDYYDDDPRPLEDDTEVEQNLATARADDVQSIKSDFTQATTFTSRSPSLANEKDLEAATPLQNSTQSESRTQLSG